MISGNSNKDRALSAMQRACSGRELCSEDIIRRIRRYKISPEEVAEVINSLEKDSFLNDKRYARAFVKDKVMLSGWGATKISWSLKNKKIDKDIIEEALEEISKDDEPERLTSILQAKLKSSRKEENPDKLKAKLIRFALSRGFSYDLIFPVVNKILCDFVYEE